jgi:GGDEF domain-containing protein
MPAAERRQKNTLDQGEVPHTSAEHAEALAARIAETVARPIAIDGSEVAVGVSVGVAVGRPAELEGLLEHADADMYRAKAAGRTRD